MAQFENSIILRVRDRAARSLARINRLGERQRKIAERINKSYVKVVRTTERMKRALERVEKRSRALRVTMNILRGSVRAVGKAFSIAGRAGVSFTRTVGRGIGGLLRQAGRLGILLGGLSPGGILAGAKNTANGIVETSVNAAAAGIGVNEYNRLVRFLEGANTEGLQREDIFDLITEAQNRFGEALIEGKGATFEGIEKLGKLIGNPQLFKQLKSADNIADQISIYLDAMSKLSDAARGQFLAEENFGGTEGRVLNKISKLPQQVIEELGQILNDTAFEITQEDIDAAHQYRLAMFRFQQSFGKAAKTVMIPLLPKLGESIENLAQNVQKFAESEGAANLAARMEEMTSSILGFASDTLDPSSKANKNLVSITSAVANSVSSIGNLADMITSFAERMDSATDRLGKLFYKLGIYRPDATQGQIGTNVGREGRTAAIGEGGGGVVRRLSEMAMEYRRLQEEMAKARMARGRAGSGQELADADSNIKSLVDAMTKLEFEFIKRRSQEEGGGILDHSINIRNYLDKIDEQAAIIEKMSATRQQAEGQMNNAILNGSNALDAFATKLRNFNPGTGGGGNAGRSGVADLGGEVVA